MSIALAAYEAWTEAVDWLCLRCIRLCLRLSRSCLTLPAVQSEADAYVVRERLMARYRVDGDPVVLDGVRMIEWLLDRAEKPTQPVRWVEADPDHAGLQELEHSRS